MTRFRHGLMIGKFYPPHDGHHAGIRDAARQCNDFTVVVMSSVVESIPLHQRVSWLREEHRNDGNVRIAGILCDAPVDIDNESVWVAQLAAVHAALRTVTEESVDAVFGTDVYVDELARRIGAEAVQQQRNFSASDVRRSLHDNWHHLAPATQAGLTVRAVFLGAESTGTTTVSLLVADHFRSKGGVWASTQWVPEYGREHTELLWNRQGVASIDEVAWSVTDFDAVAEEQTRREEVAARSGSPVLLCDNDAFAASVWERRYSGDTDRERPWAVSPQLPHHDVYFVTDHDGVPWHDDGLREGDLAVRAVMTRWFIDALTAAGLPWVVLTGTLDERCSLAVRTIGQLLEYRSQFALPLQGPGFSHSA